MSDAAPIALPLTRAQRDAVQRALAAQGQQPGALLPVLHAVQDALGFIPPASVAVLAQGLGLSRADVHGVITYYHHFRQTPPARHTLQLCQAEACRACGATELMAQATERLSAALPGAVGLEPVYCLGLCASAPALMLDEQPLGRVTPQRLDELLTPLLAAGQEAA
ncbi:NAD(P)H-dependent oxidoreductase subunit E [Amphibiibacter pelophylacis]|uniref:NAD(P)H-dependent oxidoreductase subunit E n=1 Tax=Amphibiibacter pelophylacis TaxID=1799477 RepID=A0ACC6P0U6_9BURK